MVGQTNNKNTNNGDGARRRRSVALESAGMVVADLGTHRGDGPRSNSGGGSGRGSRRGASFQGNGESTLP